MADALPQARVLGVKGGSYGRKRFSARTCVLLRGANRPSEISAARDGCVARGCSWVAALSRAEPWNGAILFMPRDVGFLPSRKHMLRDTVSHVAPCARSYLNFESFRPPPLASSTNPILHQTNQPYPRRQIYTQTQHILFGIFSLRCTAARHMCNTSV